MGVVVKVDDLGSNIWWNYNKWMNKKFVESGLVGKLKCQKHYFFVF